MTSLGFENYAEALKIYLSKYREVSSQPLGPDQEPATVRQRPVLTTRCCSLNQTGARTSRTARTVKDTEQTLPVLERRTQPPAPSLEVTSRRERPAVMHLVICTPHQPHTTAPPVVRPTRHLEVRAFLQLFFRSCLSATNGNRVVFKVSANSSRLYKYQLSQSVFSRSID